MALDLINRFAKEKPGASTDDLESLKEFVQHLAFDIDGVKANDPDEEVDVKGAKGSVIQY